MAVGALEAGALVIGSVLGLPLVEPDKGLGVCDA